MDTQWFKHIMKLRHVTQDALGESLGLDRSVISKILNGKVPLRITQVSTLAKALGVTEIEILSRSGLNGLTPPSTNRQELAELARLAFIEVEKALEFHDMALSRQDWADALKAQFLVLYALKYDDDLTDEALSSAGQAVANNVIPVNFTKR